MKIKYEIIQNNELQDVHRILFSKMLGKQGKVQGDLNQKADRCKIICIAKVDNKAVAIGAIKQKTASDFSIQKAGLPELSSDFEWELGYLYTDNDFLGKGIASRITKTLIESYGSENLMASTEITANPAMVKILEKNGFKQFGNPWKSAIHDNCLGLLLKLK